MIVLVTVDGRGSGAMAKILQPGANYCYIIAGWSAYNFSQSVVRQMSDSLENRWLGLGRTGSVGPNTSLHNLTIKEIEFNSQNQQQLLRPKNLKPAMPTKIYHHGYYKVQNKNKKMLPGLPVKAMTQVRIPLDEKNTTFKADKNFGKPIRNARNSQILNSIIDILKSDPDTADPNKTRNGRIKTEPSYLNEFIESRQISSVKNSRGPKIIGSEIMMLGNQKPYKRNLVSEEKSRPRIFAEESHSISKRVGKKLDPFDEMEMTFYKPSRTLISEQQNLNIKKLCENEFLMS